MANAKVSPLDATGKAAEDAAKKNAEELRLRKDEISISRAAEEELYATGVFDPKTPDKPILLDEVETVGVAVKNETVIIRTITDIEQMTYGVGNTLNFKAGVKYEVSRDLAAYLDNLGYVAMIG
ncbi:hypothetical protein UFOVP45_20 [uncultured Caudovirales phage]|uniref:Uncharacterized protein n=1 Tax=uncultured Caudovirales phage TaxID=2100421 RepID=A0A6J5KN00_9CAUD|nr:hypothetical protein UFOVP45_20 [uncultured Caudovirales phage]